jgi:hypothetical protein
VATALGYLLIQLPAFELGCGQTGGDCKGAGERWWAFSGLIFCVIAFFAYLWYQVKQSSSAAADELIVEQVKKSVQNGSLSLTAAFADLLIASPANNATNGRASSMSAVETSSLLFGGGAANDDNMRRFNMCVQYFFNKYDVDGDGKMDVNEIRSLLADVGENLSEEETRAWIREVDADGDGCIDILEFQATLRRLVAHDTKKRDALRAAGFDAADSCDDNDDDDIEDDEAEEVPEDFVDLPYAEQQARIKRCVLRELAHVSNY